MMLKQLFLLIVLLPSLVFADDFIAGKDYEVINGIDVTNSEKNNKISVTEFFSYGCPWCFRIESSLEQWKKQQEKSIVFSRVPVVFNSDWVYYAKAYYTAELLGLGQKFTPLLFKAIQTDKKTLTNNQDMIDFFVAEGVSKDIAESAFSHSTTVDMKVNEGNVTMARYHITAVPALVINNTYKTDLQMAKSEERLFKILDYLVALSKKK